MSSIVRKILPTCILIFSVALVTYGQDPPSNVAPSEDPPDLIGRLRLTPDQLQRIRLIQRDTKDERATIGLRLREANRALEETLDSETVDESLIEQRMQAVSSAQNAQLRLRIQTELRIRRVLNPEQLAILKEIRLRAGDIIRAGQDRRAIRPGVNGMRPNERNGIAPLRRNDPLRNPRP